MITRIAMATLFGAALLAQPPAGVGRPQGTGPSGDPAQRYEFIANMLGLSDAQKTQVKALFANSAGAAEEGRAKMKKANEDLQAAVKANKSDFEIEQLAATIGTMHGQRLAAQAKNRAKVFAILTAEQKAKLDELMKQFGQRGGGRP